MNKTNKIHEMNQWSERGGAHRHLCAGVSVGGRQDNLERKEPWDAKNNQYSILTLPSGSFSGPQVSWTLQDKPLPMRNGKGLLPPPCGSSVGKNLLSTSLSTWLALL